MSRRRLRAYQRIRPPMTRTARPGPTIGGESPPLGLRGSRGRRSGRARGRCWIHPALGGLPATATRRPAPAVGRRVSAWCGPAHNRYVAASAARSARATNTDPVLWRVGAASADRAWRLRSAGLSARLAVDSGRGARPVHRSRRSFGRGHSNTSKWLTIVLGVVAGGLDHRHVLERDRLEDRAGRRRRWRRGHRQRLARQRRTTLARPARWRIRTRPGTRGRGTRQRAGSPAGRLTPASQAAGTPVGDGVRGNGDCELRQRHRRAGVIGLAQP